MLNLQESPHSPSYQAMVRAARGLQRPGLAELIIENSLPPSAILGLMRLSLHESAVEHAAVIVLAGSYAHYMTDRRSWTPEPERGLVLSLVGGDEAAYNALAAKAKAYA